MIPFPLYSGMAWRVPFLAGTIALGAAVAGAEADPYAPRWERELRIDGAGTGAAKGAAAGDVEGDVAEVAAETRAPLGRFLLDASILSDTKDDFADLRLLDGLGKPIGIQVRPVSGLERHCAESVVPMRRLSLQVLEDTAFEAVYLAEDPARVPDRISVSVEARDFEISLSLWTASAASAAQVGKAQWTSRLRNVPLFDYSRFVDLRREEARWTAPGDRAVRLRVNGLTQTQRSLVTTLSGQVGRPEGETFQMQTRLLRVDAITFSGEVCGDRKVGSLTDTVALAASGFGRPLTEPGAKRSWFVFPADRLPLKSLTLQVGTRNFMRSAILTGWPDSTVSPSNTAARPWTWPHVAEARIHRIDWAGPTDAVDCNLRIPFFPPRRFATLALGVLDNDDPALNLAGVSAETERLEALFPGQEPGAFRMRYGDRGARPLQFDFESLLERIPASAAVALWTPGPPRPLMAEGKEADDSRFTWLTGRLLLTAGLSLAIAGLMAMVFLVARKAESAEKNGKAN